MAVFVRENKHLYCLRRNDGFWFTTLASNRRDSWRYGAMYSNGDCFEQRKQDLKDKGYTCVKVLISEIK